MLVAYFAPGAGLGHLNRALAICLPLRDEGVDARIVTNSPFAAGIAALSRCPVVELTGESWRDSAKAWVQEMNPHTIITDTFPYGLEDEFREERLCIHIARRLKKPFPMRPGSFSLIVEAEPLSLEHHATVCAAAHCCLALPGPIRLPPGRIGCPAVPQELDLDRMTLVVHSGPEAEVRELTALAEPPYTVISPWPGQGSAVVEYYPASNLYARARRVVTGAGYNSMADLLAHRHKHTAVAFDRRYDDQHARLREFFSDMDPSADGTQVALEAILAEILALGV